MQHCVRWGSLPKEKGHTKEATLTENYERLYIENGERYDAGLNGNQIGNRPWAVNSLGVPSTDPYTQRGGLLPPPPKKILCTYISKTMKDTIADSKEVR